MNSHTHDIVYVSKCRWSVSLVANHDQSLKINPQFLIPRVTKEILVYVIQNSIAIDFQFEGANTRRDSTSKKRILFIFILRQSKVIIISYITICYGLTKTRVTERNKQTQLYKGT